MNDHVYAYADPLFFLEKCDAMTNARKGFYSVHSYTAAEVFKARKEQQVDWAEKLSVAYQIQCKEYEEIERLGDGSGTRE